MNQFIETLDQIIFVFQQVMNQASPQTKTKIVKFNGEPTKWKSFKNDLKVHLSNKVNLVLDNMNIKTIVLTLACLGAACFPSHA